MSVASYISVKATASEEHLRYYLSLRSDTKPPVPPTEVLLLRTDKLPHFTIDTEHFGQAGFRVNGQDYIADMTENAALFAILREHWPEHEVNAIDAILREKGADRQTDRQTKEIGPITLVKGNRPVSSR